MMAYLAWSVVFGEQPTASKWNALGVNDAGFKDGSLIDDKAILARHLGQPVAFHAYRNAAKVIGVILADIEHDTERYDLGSNFDTGTGIFTAPYAGVYHFDSICLGEDAVGRSLMKIDCSTAGAYTLFDNENEGTGSANRLFGGSITVDLVASETVKIKALIGSSVDVANTQTFFAGYLIGRTD